MSFITADKVAELTGFSNATAFLAARSRLEGDNDFPLPMPTCLRPLKWRADAVKAWVELQGRAAVTTPAPTGSNVIMLEMARSV